MSDLSGAVRLETRNPEPANGVGLTTVTGVLAHAVANWSERIALDVSGETFTFAALDSAATRLARGLVSLGVTSGETVASILDNTSDAVVTWYAINKLGAIWVPVNTAYKGEFLRHQLADSGARIVLAEEDYVQRVLDVASGLSALQTVLHRGPHAPQTISGVTVRPLEALKIDGDPLAAVQIRSGDLAMLIYTSGTTGPSKGCMISHGYICNLARQYVGCANLRPEDVVWTALPLFHMNATGTTVLGSAMLGARAAIYPRFSLSGFWPDIVRSGATVANLLGSMAPLIADAADTEESRRGFGQLRVVNSAPFPPALRARWRERFGVPALGSAGYGLTEAAMVVTSCIGDDAPAGASGRRNNDFEVVIVDEDETPLPDGQSGEVLIRPRRNNVMFGGYWNRPEATCAVTRNLWLHTGDIGRFDSMGNFYFVDRKKDYLRRRGENISSFEMESTFVQHPDISDVAVHAVFSELGEDDVKVTAILRDGASLSEEALCLWSIERVPYFAVPRYIEFRKDLPRNPTGKILKYQLRDEGVTPATWDRERSDLKLVKR